MMLKPRLLGLRLAMRLVIELEFSYFSAKTFFGYSKHKLKLMDKKIVPFYSKKGMVNNFRVMFTVIDLIGGFNPIDNMALRL